MIVKADFINPGEMEVQLTIRMPLKDWRAVAGHLPSAWPCWDLARHIRDVILKVEATVYANPENE